MAGNSCKSFNILVTVFGFIVYGFYKDSLADLGMSSLIFGF